MQNYKIFISNTADRGHLAPFPGSFRLGCWPGKDGGPLQGHPGIYRKQVFENHLLLSVHNNSCRISWPWTRIIDGITMASKAYFVSSVTICQVSVQQKSSGQETKVILFRLLVPFLFEAVRMVERGDAKPEVLFKSAYASKIKLFVFCKSLLQCIRMWMWQWSWEQATLWDPSSSLTISVTTPWILSCRWLP